MRNYHHINSLPSLESLLKKKYNIPKREEFDRFLFQHPLRFTPYLLQQIKIFPSIAKQYIPDPQELSPIGKEKPFSGVMRTNIPGLERMYLDRVILMPTSQCFAYCRFCFRKNYSHDARQGDFGNIQDEFKEAFDYIRHDDRIKEVLITGGDPLMFPGKILNIIQELRTIPHLTSIRIGTRIFTSDPQLITKKWIEPFTEINKVTTNWSLSSDNWPFSAPVSISPHINHPDELSPETIKALLLCTQNNIPLYSQSVMLKGINDSPYVLLELFRKLRQLGVEPYRVYHADPLQGSEHFRTSLKSFMNSKRWLRAHASGRVVPSFIVDTQIGKVELGADADIIKREGNSCWIRTPFSIDLFRSVNPNWEVPNTCTLDEQGFLIVEYQDALEDSEQQAHKYSALANIIDNLSF